MALLRRKQQQQQPPPHQPQQQRITRSAPHRCFLCELVVTKATMSSDASHETPAIVTACENNVGNNKQISIRDLPTTIRVMGTLVAALSEDKTSDSSSGNKEELADRNITNSNFNDNSTIVLDDGTAQLAISAPPHMLPSLDWNLGCTVEVIANRIRYLDHDDDNDKSSLLASGVLWEADTVMMVTDPHAATLRTLELCYQRDPRYDAHSCRWGYPMISPTSVATPLHNHNYDSEDDEEDAPTAAMDTDTNITIEQVYNFICSGHDGERGVSVEELETVLYFGFRRGRATTRQFNNTEEEDDGKDEYSKQLLLMITDLQLSGQIYQDAKGNYMPL